MALKAESRSFKVPVARPRAARYNDPVNASVISVNRNVQGGTPCFVGTRVPVASLFDHLEGGYTIDYFLDQFPSVKRDQIIALLQMAKSRTQSGAEPASK